MKHRFFTFLILAAALAPSLARAFPQMMAHGYTSCVACHVSPTGGGLMSPYGRSLSREVLSQTGLEGEENALYGAVSPPSWLQLGGDVRMLQSYINNAAVEQASLILMQADFEAGFVTEKVQVVGTIGYQNPMSANATKSPILSRRHFVQYIPAENHYIRAGKFDLAYGIRWPDHFMFYRRDLGWDEGSEAYRVEWTRLSESFETTATVSIGRPDAPGLMSDRGIAFRAGYNFLERNQVGLSVYYGRNDLGPRALVGPTIAWTPFERFMVFGEVDFQRMLGERRGEAIGFVQTLRANYEVIKGLHFFAMQEFSKMDLNKPDRYKEGYTAGAQWFFRPHVEFAGGLRKTKSGVSSQGATDSAWLMMHYYL